MKKFTLHIFVFFLIVAVIDFVFGKALDYMFFNAKGGMEKELNDVCLNNQYNVLVMGSSRAHHHYVPEIIADSIGGSCYNTGKDGNGIILMYGIYRMVTERYKPSLIIYDLSQGFDIYENPDDQNNTRYLKMLKPYVRQPHIKDIFMSYSWQEWGKTYSSLYRYNSSLIETIKDYSISTPYNTDGYSKITVTMNYEPKVKEKFLNAAIDTFKIDYFKKLILATRQDNIPLVCVISPSYGVKSSGVFSPLKNVCEEYDIPLLDYYADETLSKNRVFYKDPTHLNDVGAYCFTRMLAHDIKIISSKGCLGNVIVCCEETKLLKLRKNEIFVSHRRFK